MQMALRRGPNVSLNEETIFGNKKISKNALNVWSTKIVKMNAPSIPIILFTMSLSHILEKLLDHFEYYITGKHCSD